MSPCCTRRLAISNWASGKPSSADRISQLSPFSSSKRPRLYHGPRVTALGGFVVFEDGGFAVALLQEKPIAGLIRLLQVGHVLVFEIS